MPDGLATALHDIVSDQALQKSVVYVVVCFVGQACYAFWLWTAKEIPCVVDRFRQDPQSTAHSILANMVAIITLVAALPIADTPWRTILVMAIFQGISADSAVNKNAAKEWRGEERRESVQPHIPPDQPSV